MPRVDLGREVINTLISTARATAITMNRDRISDLASGKLGLRTARSGYASSAAELSRAAEPLGWLVVAKPVMSSSDKGQSMATNPRNCDMPGPPPPKVRAAAQAW